jgi:signal transduction histidine kinase
VTLEPGNPTLVAMEAVEIFQAQASATGVSLTTEMELAPCVVMFDPARILQVLTNVLSNAMKFTPAHGRIAVRLTRLGDLVRFEVSDTGIGVPTEELEAIFERFVQLTKNDRRGVGLGLYISRAIVLGHGGRMWAENAVAGGSTFSFTLPAS